MSFSAYPLIDHFYYGEVQTQPRCNLRYCTNVEQKDEPCHQKEQFNDAQHCGGCGQWLHITNSWDWSGPGSLSTWMKTFTSCLCEYLGKILSVTRTWNTGENRVSFKPVSEQGITIPLSVPCVVPNVPAPVLGAVLYYSCFACPYRHLQAGFPSGLLILCTTAIQERVGLRENSSQQWNPGRQVPFSPWWRIAHKVKSCFPALQVLWWSPSWSAGSPTTSDASCSAMSPPATGQSEWQPGGHGPPVPGQPGAQAGAPPAVEMEVGIWGQRCSPVEGFKPQTPNCPFGFYLLDVSVFARQIKSLCFTWIPQTRGGSLSLNQNPSSAPPPPPVGCNHRLAPAGSRNGALALDEMAFGQGGWYIQSGFQSLYRDIDPQP